MQKIFLFLSFIGTILLGSCAGNDDSPATVPSATKITLTASVTNITIGDSITLNAADDLGEDITAETTFLANDVAISGATFTPVTVGTFTLRATNGILVSNDLVITVSEAEIPSNSIMIDNVVYRTDQSTLYEMGPSSGIDDSGNIFYMDNWIIHLYNAEHTTDVHLIFSCRNDDAIYPLPGKYTLKNWLVDRSLFGIEIVINSKEIVKFKPFETTTARNAVLDLDTVIYKGRDNGTWDIKYEITLANNSVVKGNFNGDHKIVDRSNLPVLPLPRMDSSIKTIKKSYLAKAKR